MSVDFTKMVKKADAGIRIIIKNYDCFEWEVFAGADFEEESERIEDALMQAAVRVAMPKGAPIHILLKQLVTMEVGNKHTVYYDWLVKATARIICTGSISELQQLVELSRKIREKNVNINVGVE